jgi:nitroreductase
LNKKLLSLSGEELSEQSEILLQSKVSRRSVRFFSDTSIPREVIENIIMAASSAPSGANKQPWIFCAVNSTEVKKKTRKAAEEEEYESYNGRVNKEWLENLKKFDTD